MTLINYLQLLYNIKDSVSYQKRTYPKTTLYYSPLLFVAFLEGYVLFDKLSKINKYFMSLYYLPNQSVMEAL
jgi:hypothetical protein